MTRRQLNDTEKKQVIAAQREMDGSLRCYISGDVIDPQRDDYEFDHIEPYSQGGETTLANIRVVLKSYNRRKSDQSLEDARDNLRLERLFTEKRNSIKLQDILDLRGITRHSIHAGTSSHCVVITDGSEERSFALFDDPILNVPYFYGRLPLKWIENDDQEGLQPRVIDYKRLIILRDHLRFYPQMAPAIARLKDGSIRLFDGQHKLAAQILNGAPDVDVKVFVSPDEQTSARKLFDTLMITNLDAHSKLRQVPFYTSTLLERLSVIYREYWEEFATKKPQTEHSEANFVDFLVAEKQMTRAKANDVFRAAVKETALANSRLAPYIAEASKDAAYPITQDIMNTTIFPNSLFLQPSNVLFDAPGDYRNSEMENFHVLTELLVDATALDKWVPRQTNTSLTDEQRKARRIWHKGAVLTWGPYLKDIIINTFNIMTEAERARLLYRPKFAGDQQQRIQTYLTRLFGHPLWNLPEGEVDSLLVSARKQEDLFKRNGLTTLYVLTGNN